jgi:hypothetical protein
MKKNYYYPLFFVLIVSLLFVGNSYAQDVPLKKIDDFANDGDNGSFKRTRFYIPLTASFESGELGLFFESNVGMCNVSIEDENGNVQMSEIIDTDNGTEFWLDLSGLSSGLHYVKISYGSMDLVGEFYVE